MNGFVFSKSHWVTFLACAILLLGCKQESVKKQPAPQSDQASDGTAPEFRVGPTAEAVLNQMVARYATASTYQDKSALYLNYQLEGRNIQEFQRWETLWDNSGKLAARMFNGKITADGDLLSCYIFDIDTANLDNQHVLIPYDRQLPLNQLFRDSIAAHFLGGYSELPLDESDLSSAPKLVPPPISLLTNQVRNGWLQDPVQVQRLKDATINGTSCYVVRSLWNGMTADIWIDSKTSLLVQMSFPLKLLVGEVVTSPEITDVVLLAKFEGAIIDGVIPDSEFALERHAESTPVRKFVALPESFPSELIGQIAPKFSLSGTDGNPIGRLDFDGRITTLLWLFGKSSYTAIDQLDSLAANLPADKYRFGAVYSDEDLATPGSGSLEVNNELAKEIQGSSTTVYYDSQLAASTALRVKVIPSVLVLDGDSKVQFTKALTGKNWAAEVAAAIERVAAGDDVATEMQTEYQRYLDSYHQQLLTVSASNLLNDKSPEDQANADLTTRQAGNIRLRPEKIWANTEFQQAGNVAVLSRDRQGQAGGGNTVYLVFDGWRTVVELDRDGRAISRNELNLPEDSAANLIRVGTDSNGQTFFAVFSTLGKTVYLFDRSWNALGVYPESDRATAGILDCQLSDLNADGSSELIVAFDDGQGIQQVNPVSLISQKISTTTANSVVWHGDDLVLAGDGKVGMLRTGLTNVEETELGFRRVASLNSNQLCAIGVTRTGRWHAVGFDMALNRKWTLSIGSQFFETEIEPIGVAKTSNGELIWAIADTEDAIHLVSGTGKWLGDFQSESILGGLSLSTEGDQTRLLVSNADGIECWSLNLSPNPMRPASMRK